MKESILVTMPVLVEDEENITMPDLVDENAMVVFDRSKQQEFHDNIDLGKHGIGDYWRDEFSKSDMSGFKAQAYKNKKSDPSHPYAIRTNPVTGLKELMIPGSVGLKDHVHNVGNVYDTLITKGFYEAKINEIESATGAPITTGGVDTFKDQHVAELIAEVIEEQDVDVVYGHSRGFAVASRLPQIIEGKSPEIIGLNGTSELLGQKSEYLNIIGKDPFDRGISAGHDNTLVLKGTAFHDVTISKKKREKAARKKAKKKKEALKAMSAQMAESSSSAMRKSTKDGKYAKVTPDPATVAAVVKYVVDTSGKRKRNGIRGPGTIIKKKKGTRRRK